MKKLALILIVAMACISTACTKSSATPSDVVSKAASNQNQLEAIQFVNETDIDPAIMQFVMTHFPQTSVLNCHMTQHLYKVRLNDRTQLEFTHSYEWSKVDCEHSTIYTFVPASIVPEAITAYVTTNFPNNFIEEIEKKAFGWEVELNNDRELKFDTNFNVINGGGNGGGGNGGGGNGGGTSSNYPEINTFVETYFPQVGIRSARQDGNEIEVKLTDKTEIEFNLNFEWKSIDCEKGQVYGSVPTDLVPAQITAYVATNFAGQTIESIEKKHNGGWEIELNNGLEITFDANFNVIEIDDKK